MVTPRLRQVVFDTVDPRKSAEFWRQFLGLAYQPGHEPPPRGTPDEAGSDWLNLLTPEGQRYLSFQHVEHLVQSTWPDSTTPQQMHLDLSVPTVADLESAIIAAKALGGRVILDESGDENGNLFVLADPDGHPFCVFVPEE